MTNKEMLERVVITDTAFTKRMAFVLLNKNKTKGLENKYLSYEEEEQLLCKLAERRMGETIEIAKGDLKFTIEIKENVDDTKTK